MQQAPTPPGNQPGNPPGNPGGKAETGEEELARKRLGPTRPPNSGGFGAAATKAQAMQQAMQHIQTRSICDVADFSKCKELKGGTGKRAAPEVVEKTRKDRKHTPAQLRKMATKRDEQREKAANGPTLKQSQVKARASRMSHLKNNQTPGFFDGHVRM